MFWIPWNEGIAAHLSRQCSWQVAPRWACSPAERKLYAMIVLRMKSVRNSWNGCHSMAKAAVKHLKACLCSSASWWQLKANRIYQHSKWKIGQSFARAWGGAIISTGCGAWMTHEVRGWPTQEVKKHGCISNVLLWSTLTFEPHPKQLQPINRIYRI